MLNTSLSSLARGVAAPANSFRKHPQVPLEHGHSAVHVHGLTRHVSGFVGGEIDDGGGDFVAPAEPSHGNGAKDPLALFVVEHVGHGRLDETRGHKVHGDVAACHLGGKRLGHADQACLGGGVIALARIARRAHHGADIDDAAMAAAHHALHGGAGEAEGGGEVHGDDHVPLLVLHAHEQVVLGHARVVDQDVEPFHGGLGRRNEGLDRVLVRQIGLYHMDALPEGGGQFVERRAAGGRQGGGGAPRGERAGGGAAAAA